MPVHEALEKVRERGLTRREVLKGAAVLGATAAASAVPLSRANAAGAPRIVVVGAGLAGMTAAYRIWERSGTSPVVYEAKSVIGGRSSTIHNLSGGQWAERGGQFVSTEDSTIRKLIPELGLSLIDTFPIYPNGKVAYRFDGHSYTEKQLMAGINDVYDTAWKQFKEIVWIPKYNKKNAATIYWDNWSVADWISAYIPGGLNSALGQYAKVYFETEYAGRIEEASAIHIIAEFGGPDDPGYDERYIIQGGSDAVVNRIAQLLPAGSIQTDTALIAIHKNADNTLRCTFQSGASTNDVTADFLVLALPFTILRQVDYASLGLGAVMNSAIQELLIGVNSKVNLGFNSAAWEPLSDGESYSDLTTGSTWPGSVGMPGSQRLGVCFIGGAFATQYGNSQPHGVAPQAVVTSHLAALEQLYPGVTGVYNGTAFLDYWPADPWVAGSYSCYGIGQFTKFGGIESKRQGRVYFAGEHTAPYEYKGTMNGAAESGEHAAKQILAAI